MCGRFLFTTDEDDPAVTKMKLMAMLKFNGTELPNGEVFPSATLPVLVDEGEKAGLELMTWGMPTSGSSRLIINARSETAAEKRMFRRGLAEQRCVIMTTGFFEWSHDGEKKKYLFRLPGTPVVYLAGLYDIYDGKPRFVILTTRANRSMAEIHDRMPIIIVQSEILLWLGDPLRTREVLTRDCPELIRSEVK